MATRKNDPVGGGEKQGTIEIAYVKLAGNDATLQAAVNAFSTLINRSAHNGNAIAPAKRVNSLPGESSNGKTAAVAREDVAATAVETDNTTENESATDDAVEARGPRQPRKYSLPTAIPIETEAAVSLSDFMAKYKLESDQDRYVAMVAWLWNHREQTTLKAGLVLTLYDRMGWKLLADVTMPMRRLVTKKFQWLEKVARGEYKITHMGENRLAKLKV